jgi:hypothetical protein
MQHLFGDLENTAGTSKHAWPDQQLTLFLSFASTPATDRINVYRSYCAISRRIKWANNIKVWLEAFAATKCDKIFSGDQPRQNGTIFERFRGPLCLHHQGEMRWLSSVCYIHSVCLFLYGPRPMGIEDQSNLYHSIRVAAPGMIQSLCTGLEDSHESLEEHRSALCQDHETRPKTQATPAFRRANTMGQNSAVPWVTLDTRLIWSAHVNQVRKKAAERLVLLSPLLNRRSGLVCP